MIYQFFFAFTKQFISLIFYMAECYQGAEVNRKTVQEYYILISSDSQVLLYYQ